MCIVWCNTETYIEILLDITLGIISNLCHSLTMYNMFLPLLWHVFRLEMMAQSASFLYHMVKVCI